MPYVGWLLGYSNVSKLLELKKLSLFLESLTIENRFAYKLEVLFYYTSSSYTPPIVLFMSYEYFYEEIFFILLWLDYLFMYRFDCN